MLAHQVHTESSFLFDSVEITGVCVCPPRAPTANLLCPRLPRPKAGLSQVLLRVAVSILKLSALALKGRQNSVSSQGSSTDFHVASIH